ncbi:hypothetical protein [Pedosphaera parvula]|uniref:Uncharacterized protein n=1 Tax=Pedosphaera parvula (strain Ellin514) TaxID=320771 RepID=B9XRZ0_PEDPL|nr:hypothetical protein [Pedosphaera parvula]EEF57401.1 hypothetical protein Cflav_PD0374 [Pedosphaera parvula Ellin514]
MKKFFVIILVAGIAASCLYFLKRPPGLPKPEVTLPGNEVQHVAPVLKEKRTVSQPEIPKLEAAPAVVLATQGDAGQKETGDKTIIHTSTDFAKGQFDNTAVDGSIHLGNDTTPTTFQSKFKLFGLFHSLPEDIPATFDMVTPSYKGTIPEGSALEFSFRTRSPEGNWSTWTEIDAESLGKPVMLDAPALSLQYKLTFFANDSASSPQITSVTMETRNTVPKAVPLAQDSNSVSSEPKPSQ